MIKIYNVSRHNIASPPHYYPAPLMPISSPLGPLPRLMIGNQNTGVLEYFSASPGFCDSDNIINSFDLLIDVSCGHTPPPPPPLSTLEPHHHHNHYRVPLVSCSSPAPHYYHHYQLCPISATIMTLTPLAPRSPQLPLPPIGVRNDLR